jgi:YVTN family beta-propeller protein
MLPRLFSALLTLALGISGAGVAVAGEAIVTNQPGDSLSVVDTATMNVLATIALSGKPAGIALSPGKKIAYVTAPDGKTLFAVDLDNRVVTQRLQVGSGPLGIAAHPVKSEIYVADWYAHKIAVLAWRTVPVIEGDVHMGGSGDDAVISARNAEVLLEVAQIPVGQSPSGLAVTPDGKWLLSADRDSNQVSVIDIESRKVIAAVPVGERPFGITVSPDGTSAYTANVGSDDVTVIDVASRAVRGTVKVGRRPYAVALSGDKGFVTDQYAGTITVFDIETLKAVKTIEACDHPEGIEARDGAVYVACWGDNLLLKIDAGTLAVTSKVEVGDGPRAFGKFLR